MELPSLPFPPTEWISLSFTTWAMDMILAFACGLGLFHLWIHFFPLTSPSPAEGASTTTKRVVKRDHNKARKKIRTLKGRLLPSPGQVTSSTLSPRDDTK
eukprot:XP_017457815.1 PREDICTED: spermatogenesis-associated protein 31-like isoform X1 [Rattus norvegicus]